MKVKKKAWTAQTKLELVGFGLTSWRDHPCGSSQFGIAQDATGANDVAGSREAGRCSQERAIRRRLMVDVVHLAPMGPTRQEQQIPKKTWLPLSVHPSVSHLTSP